MACGRLNRLYRYSGSGQIDSFLRIASDDHVQLCRFNGTPILMIATGVILIRLAINQHGSMPILSVGAQQGPYAAPTSKPPVCPGPVTVHSVLSIAVQTGVKKLSEAFESTRVACSYISRRSTEPWNATEPIIPPFTTHPTGCKCCPCKNHSQDLRTYVSQISGTEECRAVDHGLLLLLNELLANELS